MDGASKFVKGDAIAGIVIILVNIIGGLSIGILQQGVGPAEALNLYAKLTVGDGLVSQLPALLISTATGIIVTRAAGETNLGSQVFSQITMQSRPMYVAAAMLALFAALPGLPRLPFLLVARHRRRRRLPHRPLEAPGRTRRHRRPPRPGPRA
ncbi:FHIPEP family type III secretion protein [Tepidiforma flava]|uniref:FHIPEP family type III secretion protein n=1 Tax=Tepidiforma flava TaxID=3004094 RepID=UPI003571427E